MAWGWGRRSGALRLRQKQVLEKAVAGIGEVVQREDIFIHAHEQERQTVERHLQNLLKGMEPAGVEPIELFH